MTDTIRPCVICGNWKMYKTIDQALEFIDQIAPQAETVDCEVLLAVPFTAIKSAADKAKSTKVIIGAQNMNDATEGAFTGEVAASMLKDAGAQFVIVGHSERRRVFSESNAFINRKVKRALASGIRPLLCIGETYDERENKQTEQVLKKQLTECLEGIKAEEVGRLIVAYEPVWAIGTGKPATPEIAEQVQAFCRESLEELFGQEVAQRTPILYGGSVTAENAPNYLEEEDIDGLLIGSAALQPESFVKIIQLTQPIT